MGFAVTMVHVDIERESEQRVQVALRVPAAASDIRIPRLGFAATPYGGLLVASLGRLARRQNRARQLRRRYWPRITASSHFSTMRRAVAC